ncbi:MAB_1171c family putative transporter [Nocardia sp. NPDC050435]|uniref:MAB_1171c family putative transporter n=1 Tax=Nocardia sp. NPDC050435 TaxID=3155040 RepID=UPI0033D8A177
MAVFALLALLLRLPALIRKPEPGMLALCAYFGVLAFTFAMSTPPIFVAFSKWIGVPNLAGMLGQCGALAGGVLQQLVVLAWSESKEEARRRVRRRLLLMGAVMVCMAILFTISVPQMVTKPHTYAVDSAAIPSYQVYLVVYLTAYGIAKIETGRLCWRYSREIGPGILRIGLRLAAAGSIAGLVYVAARFADVAAPHLGINGHQWEPAAQLGAAIGAALMVTGWSVASWAVPLSSAWGRVRRYRTYTRLGPLWNALHEVVPDVALAEADRGVPARWSPRHSDFLLYRRLVEIRDARIKLLPYYDPDYAAAARRRAESEGLPEHAVEAVVEATNLAVAIARKRSSPAPPPNQPFTADEETGKDLHEEQQWLGTVARAFARSPIVAELVSKLHDTHLRPEAAL